MADIHTDEAGQGRQEGYAVNLPPTPPPSRPLTLWVMLLPLALLIGLMLQAEQEPTPQLQPVAEEHFRKPRSLRTPAPRAPAPTPTPATKTSARPATGLAPQYKLFVPGDDAKLHWSYVRGSAEAGSDPARTSPAAVGEEVLTVLFSVSPKTFPAGTALAGPVQLRGDVVHVNLNQRFAQSDLWSSEKATELAVYAMVNSLTTNVAQYGRVPVKAVEFAVGGKPVQTLGEFDLSGPIEPATKTLVAQS